ncbi:uncharacterized protein BJ212DRAFT_1299756 [Suillus subaureus]|uniref:Uncharacterized protein n=1 Tax=Suillus subaureus TaxID=48587 RepID=A0A9P7JDM5_9AGAM|nr:uncharacterized protein BJ212DRAFT_1299756 [Suillus subaureus]KAG1816505.1 hypothetical protein BJ212DRAFT_1299756 [Suillus subaureus]
MHCIGHFKITCNYPTVPKSKHPISNNTSRQSLHHFSPWLSQSQSPGVLQRHHLWFNEWTKEHLGEIKKITYQAGIYQRTSWEGDYQYYDLGNCNLEPFCPKDGVYKCYSCIDSSQPHVIPSDQSIDQRILQGYFLNQDWAGNIPQSLLDNFLLDNLECGTSAMNYYSKLRHVTSGMFPYLVPHCSELPKELILGINEGGQAVATTQAAQVAWAQP